MVRDLGTGAHAECARAILAKHIIEAAKQGELDQRRLRDGALVAFAKSKLRTGNPRLIGRQRDCVAGLRGLELADVISTMLIAANGRQADPGIPLGPLVCQRHLRPASRTWMPKPITSSSIKIGDLTEVADGTVKEVLRD